jgi:soluble lytic murein transglycosylase-like protein
MKDAGTTDFGPPDLEHRSRVVVASDLGAARGTLAVAAAVGVELAGERGGALLVDASESGRRGATMLASARARAVEDALRGHGFERAVARGRLCILSLPGGEHVVPRLLEAVEAASEVPAPVVVAHLPGPLCRRALADAALEPQGAVLRADLPAQRPLAALAVIELREQRVPARVVARPLGRVASRRALAGLEVGGAAGRRLARLAQGLRRCEGGQALVLALGAALAVLFVAGLLAALGGAITGASRTQRVADLAALSGARSMRDEFSRLFAPARLANGQPNVRHLDKREYLARAAAAALQAALRNGVERSDLRVSFPDARSFAPLRVRAEVSGQRTEWAEAEASPPAARATQPQTESGGGYSGPLAYRQGKPMRPDVAAAFDRLAAAARRVGIPLLVNSAYRSDAEQARLFAAHPDPKWVAPPGTSLHRCATELDLGPASAYGWLAANATRFGFLKRYPWEPWHFGYTRGPAPCSAAGNALSSAEAAAPGPAAGLPSFVPARFRRPIQRAAVRWNVSAGLLAAQLMAESNFNPFAVSEAGAQGIAQFMPGTAASYGLHDPFDAPAAIDAQAHLMSDLLRQFGSVTLALAAYNAGPAPVAACHCVPDIPETQAYVARILGLMGGAGELAVPALEVRLVA